MRNPNARITERTATNQVATKVDQEATERETPKSVRLASGGFDTSRKTIAILSALGTDVMNETVSAKTANTVCNIVGKITKLAEMERKYSSSGKPEEIALAEAEPAAAEIDPIEQRLIQIEEEKRQLQEALSARGKVLNQNPAPARV